MKILVDSCIGRLDNIWMILGGGREGWRYAVSKFRVATRRKQLCW